MLYMNNGLRRIRTNRVTSFWVDWVLDWSWRSDGEVKGIVKWLEETGAKLDSFIVEKGKDFSSKITSLEMKILSF